MSAISMADHSMAPMFLSDFHLLTKGHSFFVKHRDGVQSCTPTPVVFGCFRLLFFPQADGEEIPKSSGDESEPSKIDPSRLGSELVN